MSHPARDAWIEIAYTTLQHASAFLSHPARDAWIEMISGSGAIAAGGSRIPRGMRGLKYTQRFEHRRHNQKSHPARDAWIEMLLRAASASWRTVASREGCVD